MFSDLSTTDIVLLLMSIIISLVLHETMHGYAAHWLGDDTASEAGRLTINPLKHIDPLTTIILPAILIITTGVPFLAAKPVPFNPNRLKYDEYGTAIVGIAGPLTNFALAILAAVVFRLFGNSLHGVAYEAVVIFGEVNIGVFIFNMIPFPPLDGSRLLYAFAPEPVQELMQRIEGAGFGATLIFIFFVFYVALSPIEHIESSLLQFLFG
jgi:Zn-dependent protease